MTGADSRSATEVWGDWFNARGGVWFGLGDAGAGPYCQCEAAIAADSDTGERMAFLFRTFSSEGTGWFMVLDYYDGPDRPRRTPQVEWIQDCEGLLHGVTRLADFVATLVPDLADAGCPGLLPAPALIARMEEIESAHDALTEHHTPEQSTALSPDYRRAAGICVAALDLADLDEHGDRVTLNRIINHTISDGLRAALGFPCVDGDNLHAFVLRTLDLTDPVDPRDAEIARLLAELANANQTITDLQEHR